jgi:hypothetical protein
MAREATEATMKLWRIVAGNMTAHYRGPVIAADTAEDAVHEYLDKPGAREKLYGLTVRAVPWSPEKENEY